MLAAASTSRLVAARSAGAGASRTLAAATTRRSATAFSPARALSSSSSSSTARSGPASRNAAAIALGLAGGALVYLSSSSSARRPIALESRPSYSERLTRLSKPEPVASKADKGSSQPKQAKKKEEEAAPAAGDKAEDVAKEREEAAQGTASFAASLSETGAAPEAAEVVVEGSDASSQQAAYDPDTGEINWDCPCLGGMAHGSCGEQFKAAFSCFVYSEREPKGIECVDRFQAMQDCFRQHPVEYADEIADEERFAAEQAAAEQEAAAAQSSSASDSDKSKAAK